MKFVVFKFSATWNLVFKFHLLRMSWWRILSGDIIIKGVNPESHVTYKKRFPYHKNLHHIIGILISFNLVIEIITGLHVSGICLATILLETFPHRSVYYQILLLCEFCNVLLVEIFCFSFLSFSWRVCSCSYLQSNHLSGSLNLLVGLPLTDL